MDSREDLLERLRRIAREVSRTGPGADAAQDARALREEIEDILDTLNPAAAIPPPPPSDALAADGLAIVVGHSAQEQGAGGLAPPFPRDDRATPLSERHEYAWNSDLARRIKARASRAGIRCDIFFRDGVGIPGAYANVRRWSPRATVELHFNAANGSARGTEVLYGQATSKPWADALQGGLVGLYGRTGSTNRGVKLVPPRGRGHLSVTQLHPSALIEPFFGDSPADAALGISRKEALAETVLAAYAELAGLTLPRPDTPDTDTEPENGTGIPDVALLRELIAAYRAFTPTVPGVSAAAVGRLKGITLAQWIEESGWARSDLAALHLNFAGMKGIAEVAAILRDAPATTVLYEAHDGIDTYLKFAAIRDFIRGYFLFLERSPYRGWHEKAESSPHDFIRFIGPTWAQRQGYADRVIAIEGRLRAAGIVAADGSLAATDEDDAPAASGDVDAARVRREGATAEFLALLDALEPDAFPGLRAVLVAQWALESDWGRSGLARVHANFAGIPWTDRFAGLAAPVPHPDDPARGTFCRFLTPATFVQGYRHRLDTDPALAGWTERADDPARFARFLGTAWRPGDPDYAGKIRRIARRISAPGEPEPQPDTTTLAGVVLQIRRLRAERRPGLGERTASSYQLFVDGRPVEGVAGMMLEPRGPGDNAVAGSGQRIGAGVYPLSTHAGSAVLNGVTKYRTIGFTPSTAVGAPSRPSLRLDATGRRAGILIHPGDGYLWSVGCLNATRPLAGAGGNMDHADSRARVIGLIEAVHAAVGRRFPAGNNAAIPGASVEVIGEPGPAGSDTLGTGGFDARAYDRAELAVAAVAVDEAVAAATGDALAAPDLVALHDALAAKLTAAARLGQAEDGSVDRISTAGIVLGRVRGAAGETLWNPWALAVSAAGDDHVMRARLGAVARRLHDAGVPVDDAEGAHTALVRAAMRDDVSAIEALLAEGAAVDLADRSGLTPLLAAAWFGAPAAVAALLSRGADPRATVAEAEDGPELDAEVPAPGDDAAACAAAGAALAPADPARLAEYARIADLIRDAR